jgi:hypothetical protein
VKGQSDSGAFSAGIWGVSANGYGGYFEGYGHFTKNVTIGSGMANADLDVNGILEAESLTWGTNSLGTDQGGAIELGDSLGMGNAPYIDFHRGVGSAQDYNVRIQNDADQQLRVDGKLAVSQGLSVSGDLQVATGLTVSGGDLSVDSGDLEVTAGDLRVGSNVTVAASGDLTLSGGELSVSSMGPAATISATNTSTLGAVAFYASSPNGTAVHAVSTSGSAGLFEGAVHVTANLTKAYTTGTSNRAAPIAYATIDAATGAVIAGTPNVSGVWDSANQRYAITIAGEIYSTTGYITTVTPVVSATPEALFATTGAGAGQLRVRIMSSSTGTTGLQRPFSFITYKP